MNEEKEPTYEIIRPDDLFITEANQKLLDQGFGKWGKPLNAKTWRENGGSSDDLFYFFFYEPITFVSWGEMMTMKPERKHKNSFVGWKYPEPLKLPKNDNKRNPDDAKE